MAASMVAVGDRASRDRAACLHGACACGPPIAALRPTPTSCCQPGGQLPPRRPAGAAAPLNAPSRPSSTQRAGQRSTAQHSGRAPDHEPRGVQLRGHVSQLELRGLEVAHRAPKLVPRADVVARGVQAELRAAQAAGGAGTWVGGQAGDRRARSWSAAGRQGSSRNAPKQSCCRPAASGRLGGLLQSWMPFRGHLACRRLC